MTVKAVEGTLKVPAAPETPADLLGFGRSIPGGQMVMSEAFYPNPDNDPNSSALFNIFLESHDFTGDVYLVKTAPSDSKEFQGCYFRIMDGDSEKAWSIMPDEHLCDTAQEPENGVGYCLVMFGTTPGQE